MHTHCIHNILIDQNFPEMLISLEVHAYYIVSKQHTSTWIVLYYNRKLCTESEWRMEYVHVHSTTTVAMAVKCPMHTHTHTHTHLCLLKLCLNLSDDPLERLDGKFVHFGHPLGAEGRSKEDVEEEGGIELGLFRELVVSLHDH